MAEAAQTQPGPWPSWRAILWAPALPGVPLWAAWNVYAAFFTPRDPKANLVPLVSLAVVVAVGYGVALLCALFHWPIWRLRWHGPWAFATIGVVITALASTVPEWDKIAVNASLFVLTAVNFWWITYRGIGLVHRVVNGLWVASPVLAYYFGIAIERLVFGSS